MFGEDSEDSDSSSEGEAGMDGRPELVGRARWLKKATTAVVKKAARVQVAKPKEEAKVATAQLRKTPQVAEAALTEEELQRKLGELMSARGRKGTDPREVLRKLEVLTRGARKFGAKVEIPILMHLVSAMYDATRGIDDYMDVQQWRTCYRCLTRIMSLLDATKTLSLGIMTAEDATDLLAKTQTSLMAKKKAVEETEEEARPVDPNVIPVVGTLGSFVQRLEDEYTKALQQINPHTSVRCPLAPPCRLRVCCVIHPLANNRVRRRVLARSRGGTLLHPHVSGGTLTLILWREPRPASSK